MHVPSLLLLLLTTTAFLATAKATDPFTPATTIRIDCGATANSTSQFDLHWLSDRFFSGGSSAGLVADPDSFPNLQESTLRFFPPTSSGKKSCYSVPLPPARYYLRTFTVYDNYDSKLRPPSFKVSVESTPVFTWSSPWPGTLAQTGAYSDLFVFIPDGVADVCFYSVATDPPVVSTIELVEVHSLSYDAATTGTDLVLVNYGRITCGSQLFGPGFTNDSDLFSRVWEPDTEFRDLDVRVESISAQGKVIKGAEQMPNYFPTKLYESAVTTVSTGDRLDYLLPVDSRLDYMVWLHFAEIDPTVLKAGQRVFDVYVDGVNAVTVDIFKEVGGFTAFKWSYVVKNLTSSMLNISLVPVMERPLICGLENYAMVPLEVATVPSQVKAMQALKESLRVPDRMGWNGDPCAPTSWDAWEGVTCHHSGDGKNLVISQLDLGSQGLKGYISDEISLLTNLVSLNLSLNSVGGSLPLGLGQKSLVILDLSSNQFTGSIPDSLVAAKLETVLLNNNQLEGQVPEEIYSVGVHGGIVDLSGNKGLCGVPTLPACPMFWDKRGISTAGKIAIGISCVVVVIVVLVVYLLCIRKKNDDYDFDVPQDLVSIAAKRNRYQKQKLMLIEMESADSTSLPTTRNTV